MVTQTSPTPFFTRQGHIVKPAAGATIRPRRGVFALAISNGLALFVEPKDTLGILEIPGGGIEAGENHDQAMAREWAEETGIPFTVSGPKANYQHVRGFYAEDVDEFWIYDQTFRLYDYTGAVKADQTWINPEGDRAAWMPIAHHERLRLHASHKVGIDALLAQSKS